MNIYTYAHICIHVYEYLYVYAYLQLLGRSPGQEARPSQPDNQVVKECLRRRVVLVVLLVGSDRARYLLAMHFG